jgi:hypothetical protein
MSPAPGIPNNPDGVNSWSGWASEPQYGEATRWAREESAAPVAGKPLASGAIRAPERAQRRAVRGIRPAISVAAVPAPVAVPPPVEAPVFLPQRPSWPDAASVWARLAKIPGITPLAAAYAQAAARAAAPPLYGASVFEVVHPDLGPPPTGPPPPELIPALRGPARQR